MEKPEGRVVGKRARALWPLLGDRNTNKVKMQE